MKKNAKVIEDVMGRLLKPIGFDCRGSIYIRQSGLQVHGIDFQSGKHGNGEFTINLCFHYSFIPSCATFEAKDPLHFKLIDFGLRDRLGMLVKKEDVWFTTNTPQKELMDQMEGVANSCISVFKNCESSWGEVDFFPRFLALEAVREWLDWLAYSAKSTKDFSVLLSEEAKRFSHWPAGLIEFFHGWGREVQNTLIFLIECSIRSGRKAVALEYLELANRLCYDYDPFLRRLEKLRAQCQVPLKT